MQPVRQRLDPRLAIVAVVCLGGLLVGVAPLILFFSVYGDPYGRGFVERREDGLYARLRPCDGDTIHSVAVSRYTEDEAVLPAPFWTARSRTSAGAAAVRLFTRQSDFISTSARGRPIPATYVVVINAGRSSESWVTVTETLLKPGPVEFGGDSVSVAAYLAMPDSDFGCA